MEVVKAVLIDLMDFAAGGVTNAIHRLLPARRERLGLPPMRPSLLMPPLSVPLLNDASLAMSDERIHYQRYFVGEAGATLYVHPTITFDGVVSVLPYGTEVIIQRFEGRFASVTANDRSGWILKDELVATLDELMPQFVVGTAYEYDHPDTLKLRKAIDDEFSGAVARAPLSGVEYVTYKLLRKGRTIPWGPVRPRLPGTWQRILKGQRGVHSGIVPKTGSVMEYQRDHGGALAYVEAVAPDDTIRISMVADDDDARYLELELSKESWRELRPIFIEIL